MSLLSGLALAFATGILLADAEVLRRGPALAAGLHLAALAVPWRRRRVALSLTVALCAGAAAHGARLEEAARHALRGPEERTVEASVAEVARRRWGTRIRLEAVRAVDAGGPLPSTVVVEQEHREPAHPGARAWAQLVPGSRHRMRLRLRPVHGLRNPGGSDAALRGRRAGVGAEGRLAHPALHAEVRPAAAWRRAWHDRRREAASRLASRGEGGALLAALGLGEAGALPTARRDALARLGLAHLLAVSGLHLALAAGLAFALVRRVAAAVPGVAARADPRRVALGAALGMAALHATATGLGVPVQRAFVLLAAAALAGWGRRSTVRGPALAAAALLVLCAEPGALFAPGAQLSFAATAALLGARRRAAPDSGAPPSVRARLRQGLEEGAAATAAAGAATAPLAAWHFGLAAPLGTLVNLVALPLVGAALLPAALLAAAVAAFADGAFAGALLDAAATAAGSFLRAADALATHAPARTDGTPARAAVLAAALAVWPALRARRLRVRLGAAGAGSLVLALAPPAAVVPGPPRVVALDVGAGDAVLVQTADAAILVDGAVAIPGRLDLGAAVVVPALRALGVARLDLVIASHADLDHRGGLPAVLEALPVGAVWLPRGGLGDEAFEVLCGAARRRGIPVRERGLGDPPARFGSLRLVPLWPPAQRGPRGRNDRSLVVRAEAGGRRVLLAGDLEAAGERALLRAVPAAALRAGVLKLPHHGSATSSTARFLDAVAPSVAVASAARFPRHPMPAAEVVARLQRRGVRLYETGRDGAVRVALAPGLPAWTASGPGRRGPAPRRAPRPAPPASDMLPRWRSRGEGRRVPSSASASTAT